MTQYVHNFTTLNALEYARLSKNYEHVNHRNIDKSRMLSNTIRYTVFRGM